MKSFLTAVLLLGLSASAIRGQDQNTQLPLTVDVATTSTIRLNRDLVQYSGYYFDVVFYENGELKDLTGLLAKIQAKKVEDVYPPVDEFLFQDDGTVFVGESRAEFPVQPGYLGTNSVGNVRFELQLLTGTSVDVRVQLDSYVIPGVATGNEQEYVPPDPADNYYDKGEIDAMLTYMAEWNIDETWDQGTILTLDNLILDDGYLRTSTLGIEIPLRVDDPTGQPQAQFYNKNADPYWSTIANGVYTFILEDVNGVAAVNSLTNKTGRVEFDDTEVYFSGVSKVVTFDPQVYFQSPVTMNNQLTVDAEATVENNMIINGTLDVTGAYIKGGLVQTDTIEAVAGVAAKAWDPVGSVTVSAPLISKGELDAQTDARTGYLAPTNTTYQTLHYASDTQSVSAPLSVGTPAQEDYHQIAPNVRPLVIGVSPPATTTAYPGETVFSDKVFMDRDLSLAGSLELPSGSLQFDGDITTDTWFIGKNGSSQPAISLVSGTSGSAVYFLQDNPASITQIMLGHNAGAPLRYRIYTSDSGGATGTYLQIGDAAAQEFVRMTSVGNPIAFGDGTPAASASSGEVVFTETAYAESNLYVDDFIFDEVSAFPTFRINPASTATSVHLFRDTPAGVAQYIVGYNSSGLTRYRFYVTDTTDASTTYLQIGDAAPKDHVKLFGVANPLVLGSADPTSSGGEGDTIVTGSAYFDAAVEMTGTLDVSGKLTATTGPDLNTPVTLVPTVGGTGTLQLTKTSTSQWNFRPLNDPDLTRVSLFSISNATAAPGLATVDFGSGAAGNITGNIRYLFYNQNTTDAAVYFQVGDTVKRDMIRLRANAAPLVIGEGTTYTGTPANGEVVFTSKVWMEEDLEMTGDIIWGDNPDARIPIAYTPGVGAAQKVVIQFGNGVMVGGQLDVTLDLALDASGTVSATYEGATAGNWGPLGVTWTGPSAFSIYGQSGETVEWVCYGLYTP